MALEDGTRFYVLAPVVRGRKGEYEGLLDELAHEGSHVPASMARSLSSPNVPSSSSRVMNNTRSRSS